MKAIDHARLAALQLRLEDEEQRYQKAETRLQAVTGDDGALPPFFTPDFHALREQVKSDLESTRSIGKKIQDGETSNRKLLRHFRQSSKAKEQQDLMAESLETCRIRINSLETTLERWSRDQELAELVTQMRSLSKTQANNAVAAQKHLSGLHEKLDQLKRNEKSQDHPSTSSKPQDEQPSHPAALQIRETIGRLHHYCVTCLNKIHKVLQGDELLELYTRLSTWGFGLLVGPCALDAVPLVGSVPQHNSQYQRVSAWFVEISTNLFIMLVHLEVVLRLLKLDDETPDHLLNNVPAVLESTAYHLKSSDIRSTMMRSSRAPSKSNSQDLVSALVADHLLAVNDRVTSLFELNPMVEAVRHRHCYYSYMPWLTKAIREPRQKKTDWHEMLESQITKVMALLIESGVFDRTTSTRTLAISVAEQFEEELARLEQWKVQRHDEFGNDDILEPEVSALIGTLELWLRRMDLKTIKDAKGRREWTSAEASDMLEEIRPALDNVSRFLNAQAPPHRPESVASETSAKPHHGMPPPPPEQRRSNMSPHQPQSMPPIATSTAPPEMPYPWQIHWNMPPTAPPTDITGSPYSRGKGRESGSSGRYSSGRYSSAREDVVHTFRPPPKIRPRKVEGIEEELPDREKKPRRDSASTTTTDSEHRRTAIWDMLKARRLQAATPNSQPENAR